MPRAKKVDDLEKLQGSWSIVSLEVDGRQMPSSGARILIQGGNFTAEGMGSDYSGRVKLDAARTPKTFDLQFTSGPEKGNANLGIYELDVDTWKICLDMTGKARPARFASGPGVALETLQRGAIEAEPTPAPELPPGGPTEDIQGEWVLLTCVSEGMALPESMTKQGKRIATASEITVTMGPQVVVKAKYRVNRDKQPNTIDYLTARNQLQYGIFQVDGNTLRTCFAPPGRPRPTDFASDRLNQRTFTEWKKV